MGRVNIFIYAVFFCLLHACVLTVFSESSYNSRFLEAYENPINGSRYLQEFQTIDSKDNSNLAGFVWGNSYELNRPCEEYAGCSFYGNLKTDGDDNVFLAQFEGDTKCVIKDAICYEYVESDCVADFAESDEPLEFPPSSICEYDAASILRDYDVSIFSAFSKLLTSLISLPLTTIADIVAHFHSSYVGPFGIRGNGGLMFMLSFLNPFADMMQVMEDSLIIKLNGTAWEQFKNNTNFLGGDYHAQIGDVALDASGSYEFDFTPFSLADMNKVVEFFVLPHDFDINMFVSGIDWEGGILSNLLKNTIKSNDTDKAYEAAIEGFTSLGGSDELEKQAILFEILASIRLKLEICGNMLNSLFTTRVF